MNPPDASYFMIDCDAATVSLEETHAVTRRRSRSSCHAGATSATIR